MENKQYTYKIYSTKRLFSHSETLLDTSNQDNLNLNSKSVELFKLSEQEANDIKNCDSKLEEISKQINQIGEIQRLTREKRRAIQYCNDPNLADLIKSHISRNHKIECRIDRIQQLGEITIHNCDNKQLIQQLFANFLKCDFHMKREGYGEDPDDHLRIIVTYFLHERDRLIKGLELSQEVHRIPSARQDFQGC